MIESDTTRVSVCFNDENPLKIKLIEGEFRQELLATIEHNILNN